MVLLARLKVALAQFDGVLETAVGEPAPRIPHIVGAHTDLVHRRTWFRVQKKLLQTGIEQIERGAPITPFMQMLYEATAMTIMAISKRLLEAEADGGNANKRSTLLGDWGRGQRWAGLTEDEQQDALLDEFLTVRPRETRLVGARADWDIMFERLWKQVINKSNQKQIVKRMLGAFTVTQYQEFLESFENRWLPYWQMLNAKGEGQYIMGMERFIKDNVWRVTPEEKYGRTQKNMLQREDERKEKVKTREYQRKYDTAEVEVVEDLDPEFDIGGL